MIRSTLAASVAALSLTCHAAEPATEAAVEAALTEYANAQHAGDAEGMRERSHHAISRYSLADRYFNRASRDWLRRHNWDTLQFAGSGSNESGDAARIEIDVYDVARHSAAAKLVTESSVDLVHLVIFDGTWQIVDSATRPIVSGAEPPAQSEDDLTAVREVVENYCLGFYHVDGDRVQDTCHSGLSKRQMQTARPEQGGFSFMRSITYEEIEILGNAYNANGHIDAETAPVEIDVYYVDDEMAAAKLTAAGWFDYFHLFKIEGEWKIANIIFEPLAG